ncbi:MAG: hypothetical protein ACKO7P_10010 [Bacteroidota bacterium]
MKNVFLTSFLFLLFFQVSNVINAQTTQASFVGTWKMNPSNPSHSLSKIKIVDNGSSVTVTLKNAPFKKFTGKFDSVERKLYITINNITYFFVHVPANDSLMGYELLSGNMFANYIK